MKVYLVWGSGRVLGGRPRGYPLMDVFLSLNDARRWCRNKAYAQPHIKPDLTVIEVADDELYRLVLANDTSFGTLRIQAWTTNGTPLSALADDRRVIVVSPRRSPA